MFPSVQTSTNDLVSALNNSQVHSTTSGGSKAYLQFDFKTGRFFFGRDKAEVTGEEIAVNVASFQHGWTIWADGKPHKQMVSFTQPLPLQPAPMGDNQPSEARSFEGRFPDDPDTIVSFDTNSFGGRKGCDNLLNAVRMKANTGAEYLFPIVRLDDESYKAKTGGTIHNPVFTITGWMNQNGDTEGSKMLEDDFEEEAAEPTPPRRTRRVA